MGFGIHGDPKVFVPKPLVSLTDDRGNTALHVAARDACCSALRELLSAAQAMEEAHANTREQHAAGPGAEEAPAQAASAPESPQLHPVLMRRNKAGMTPLHCAVLGGSAACVSLLLAAAPVATSAVDRLGVTAQQCAIQRGCPSDLLAAFGVNDCETPPVTTMSEVGGRGAVAKVATAGASAAAGYKGPQAPMLLVTSPDCLAHHTAKPPLLRGVSIPPENIKRLEVRPFIFTEVTTAYRKIVGKQ